MGRQPRRASGLKALQAIKETSQQGRTKAHVKQQRVSSENPSSSQPGLKRASSPGSIVLPSAKRNALGDVTNNAVLRVGAPSNNKPTKKTEKRHVQTTLAVKTKKETKTSTSTTAANRQKRDTAKVDLNVSVESSQTSSVASEDTPVTAVQNFLQATTLSDDSLRSEESMIIIDSEESAVSSQGASQVTTSSSVHSQDAQQEVVVQQMWTDIDKKDEKDPLFSSEYAPHIYTYMRQREEHFSTHSYMSQQPDINASMRTILVDWLIEVQENFELFHETLYIAVRLVDLYLSQKEVKREYLQLVGATCMLIAAKFEELSPPLVDDFLYLCDDAYTHNELLKMERDILKIINYDINIPVAYRFLRRLARAAEATMETHTLARYFSESTLQEYDFITEKPSLVAACSMYLAIRMKKLGAWTPTLQHYSGYSVEQMLPLVERLNQLIQSPLGQTSTVRSKYSHEVFFKVALTAPLDNVVIDAQKALIECPTVPRS